MIEVFQSTFQNLFKAVWMITLLGDKKQPMEECKRKKNN